MGKSRKSGKKKRRKKLPLFSSRKIYSDPPGGKDWLKERRDRIKAFKRKQKKEMEDLWKWRGNKQPLSVKKKKRKRKRNKQSKKKSNSWKSRSPKAVKNIRSMTKRRKKNKVR